jgi:hypothetical protein
MAKKRIGILTGGGDVPGLNSVIKTVTYRGSENDIEVVGLQDIVPIELASYGVQLQYEREARMSGYSELK